MNKKWTKVTDVPKGNVPKGTKGHKGKKGKNNDSR